MKLGSLKMVIASGILVVASATRAVPGRDDFSSGDYLPGIIALKPPLDAVGTTKEVYVPEPIVFVHGVASNVQTYENVLPKIYGLFRDIPAGSMTTP